MKKVFIGGSRKIADLNGEIRYRLDTIMSKQLAVLVGDAPGADKAVQSYLADHHYPNVEVFCSEGKCRNNIADWHVRVVKLSRAVKGFEYFTAKDAAMAREADVGLMLWDGESAGTIVNTARLVAAGKPVVIYLDARHEFTTVRRPDELRSIIAGLGNDHARGRIERYIAEHAPEFSQAATFA